MLKNAADAFLPQLDPVVQTTHIGDLHHALQNSPGVNVAQPLDMLHGKAYIVQIDLSGGFGEVQGLGGFVNLLVAFAGHKGHDLPFGVKVAVEGAH